MKTLLHFVMLMMAALAAIVIGVILGNYGSWYFAWVVGTIMIVLFAAAGGVLLDSQENETKQTKRRSQASASQATPSSFAAASRNAVRNPSSTTG